MAAIRMRDWITGLAVGVHLLLAPAAAAGAPSSSPVACDGDLDLCTEAGPSRWPLIVEGRARRVVGTETDHPGVALAARNLAADLASIGGEGGVSDEALPIYVGTLGTGGVVDELVETGKLDVSSIEGRWEAYLQTVVSTPEPGVEAGLVIAGADPRGTIFGIYDLAERAGMSPWHYWADVPPDRHENLWIKGGSRSDAPAVRYRGIFLNDEEPALGEWARSTFGGLNAEFYEHVFDLILRLRGNYLWPAMWGKAFYDDDPANGALAERMGLVMGTSHHEPLTRAHVEWERYGEGPWDYRRNAEALRTFWQSGLERLGDGEALVTIGMRGDGDEAMTEGTAIDLLERIVADQRSIIEEVTGAPASETPQVWALYKEVQDYYDQGMTVPDDVTLLFADDNWGNIRRLPKPGAERPGGYGVYYHFDYVGGPRNYKWLNVTQLARTWEQMRLAWQSGVETLWVVNVGDLKPMELPIDFSLDMAWDPEAMTVDRMDGFAWDFAAQTFGGAHAPEIGELLETYATYNSRRTPELLDAETFDLRSGEWGEVAQAYAELAVQADRIKTRLPDEYLDAYVQLVWFPIKAMANLYELYHQVALNRWHAAGGRAAAANDAADRAEAAFAEDEALTRLFHEDVAGGKWDHMMSQTHIGYEIWQQPDEQVMPELVRLEEAAASKQMVPIPKDAVPQPVAHLAVSACRVNAAETGWVEVPGLGLWGSAMILEEAAGAPFEPGAGPRLDFPFDLATSGPFTVEAVLSPSFAVYGADGVRLALALDDGPATVLTYDLAPDEPDWNEAVGRRSVRVRTEFDAKSGRHTLRFHPIDRHVVLQSVTIAEDGLGDRYLGPVPDNGAERCQDVRRSGR